MSASDDGNESDIQVFEDSADEGQDSLMFENIESSKDFKVITREDLLRTQTADLEQVAQVVGVPISKARILLGQFQWGKEALLEKFFADSDAVMRKAGLATSDTTEEPPAKRVPRPTCGVCFDEVPREEGMAMVCDHFFCRGCWRGFLEDKIKDGQASTLTCPGFKCKLAVSEDVVKSMVERPTYEKYAGFLLEAYVQDNPYLRWCPAAGCTLCVKAMTKHINNVTCKCSNLFCFTCGDEGHAPATCPMIAAWRRKCADDSETGHWIVTNTKPCPKCKKAIEKNGGCNHVTCPCGNHFCWVCGIDSPTSELIYNHACNRYTDKNGDFGSKDAAREALQRFVHYFDRFQNHENSKKLEKQKRAEIKRKMDTMQDTWRATEERQAASVQFLGDGHDQLVWCRTTLKFTYVLGFYMAKDTPTRELFEFAQERLERETEQLAALLEMPPDEINKQQIVDQTNLAANRRNGILDIVVQEMELDYTKADQNKDTRLKCPTCASMFPQDDVDGFFAHVLSHELYSGKCPMCDNVSASVEHFRAHAEKKHMSKEAVRRMHDAAARAATKTRTPPPPARGGRHGGGFNPRGAPPHMRGGFVPPVMPRAAPQQQRHGHGAGHHRRPPPPADPIPVEDDDGEDHGAGEEEDEGEGMVDVPPPPGRTQADREAARRRAAEEEEQQLMAALNASREEYEKGQTSGNIEDDPELAAAIAASLQ